MDRGDSSILDDLLNSPEFLSEGHQQVRASAVAGVNPNRQSIELLEPLLQDLDAPPRVGYDETNTTTSAAQPFPCDPISSQHQPNYESQHVSGVQQTEEVTGAAIRSVYPNDLHFVCGCANFDPSGHNEELRCVARQHFTAKISGGDPNVSSGQCKVRAEVSEVMALAHAKAEQVTGTQGSRFRIWKPKITGKKRLNEANWEAALFTDITDNLGSLKKNLEWPLRRALEDARKALTGEGEASSNNPADRARSPVPDEHHSSKRIKRESPEDVVRGFVEKYDDQEYQDALERLGGDRGSRDIEEWAKELYINWRDHKDDEHAKKLNNDRKKCLGLLYDLVRAWGQYDYSGEFEQAILHVFKIRRLRRILSICLPMDRAQSLYKMIDGTQRGMHWYSRLHLESGNAYARDHAEGQKEWQAFIQGYRGDPTMNHKMFRLLFSDCLGLQKDEDFQRWSMPAKVPEEN